MVKRMRMKIASPSPLFQLAFLLLLLVFPGAEATDFIRTNCDTSTLYPALCYHSLAGYANAVQKDPALLARVAVGVSLSGAKHIAIYVANVSAQADDPRAASALHDCFSVLGDAVDQIRQSLKQMKRLGQLAAPTPTQELRYQLSNVQTWMSAALTNEDTCVDGFQDHVPLGVYHRTLKVKELTSNALALVNMFVSKLS